MATDADTPNTEQPPAPAGKSAGASKLAKAIASAKRKPAKRGAMKRGESKHSERRIEAVFDQAKALEYRKMGLNYSQIAEKMELNSAQAAWYMVEAALKRTLQEAADDVRKLELERLDAMFIPVYGNALRGDLASQQQVLRIMERRAKLLGIDAPVATKTEHTGVNGDPLGVLVAPAVMTPDAWTAIAKAQQEALTREQSEQHAQSAGQSAGQSAAEQAGQPAAA